MRSLTENEIKSYFEIVEMSKVSGACYIWNDDVIHTNEFHSYWQAKREALLHAKGVSKSEGNEYWPLYLKEVRIYKAGILEATFKYCFCELCRPQKETKI